MWCPDGPMLQQVSMGQLDQSAGHMGARDVLSGGFATGRVRKAPVSGRRGMRGKAKMVACSSNGRPDEP